MIIELHGDNSSLSGTSGVPEVQPPRIRNSKIFQNQKSSYGREYVNPSVSDEPKSLSEAVTSSNGMNWIQAMKKEMNSLYENEVWDLVELPEERKTLGNKMDLQSQKRSKRVSGMTQSWVSGPRFHTEIWFGL